MSKFCQKPQPTELVFVGSLYNIIKLGRFSERHFVLFHKKQSSFSLTAEGKLTSSVYFKTYLFIKLHR